MSALGRSIVASALLALAGCASVEHRAPVTCDKEGPLGPPVAQFDIEGRMALRQGQRTDHLRFVWQHDPQHDGLTLSSPLGQTVAVLHREASGASLQLGDGRTLTASDWRLLARQVVDGEAPLDELPEWLRGARGMRIGSAGDWHVEVTDVDVIDTDGAGGCRRLPRVLDADGPRGGLRLVVDSRG